MAFFGVHNFASDSHAFSGSLEPDFGISLRLQPEFGVIRNESNSTAMVVEWRLELTCGVSLIWLQQESLILRLQDH